MSKRNKEQKELEAVSPETAKTLIVLRVATLLPALVLYAVEEMDKLRGGNGFDAVSYLAQLFLQEEIPEELSDGAHMRILIGVLLAEGYSREEITNVVKAGIVFYERATHPSF